MRADVSGSVWLGEGEERWAVACSDGIMEEGKQVVWIA